MVEAYRNYERINLLNLLIDNVTNEQALDFVDNVLKQDKPQYIVTPNTDFLLLADEDERFAKIINNADLILTDGMPLIWLSKLLKKPIKERITGASFMIDVCSLAAEKGYSIFLLGGIDDIPKRAADNLKLQFPNLHVCGYYSPPLGFEKSEKQLKLTNELISKSKPDILFVCLGAPKQERFIFENMSIYQARLSLGVGAGVDFCAKSKKRAPKWIQVIGFEWLFRLLTEPRRLYKRYLNDFIFLAKKICSLK